LGCHYILTKDCVIIPGLRVQRWEIEEEPQKKRPGTSNYKFFYFRILSRKLDGSCNSTLSSGGMDLKVACATTSVFQPVIQELDAGRSQSDRAHTSLPLL
jgi:hypothetical protein